MALRPLPLWCKHYSKLARVILQDKRSRLDLVKLLSCRAATTLAPPVRNFSSSIDNTPKQTTTDEGVVIYTSDPSRTNANNNFGLVWGSVIWPSGVSLSKYLVANPTLTNDKRVLELGCGTALVGLTISKLLSPKQVTLTDFESSLWPLVRKSIQANEIDNNCIKIHSLDWRDTSTFLPYSNFDLIVASDVLYSGMDKLFARVLASHLGTKGEALVASPFRKDSPLVGFFGACERLGLSLERLECCNEGSAAGAVMGVNTHNAFSKVHFVGIDTEERRHEVATEPTFSEYNKEQVQIFRIRRVSGSPEDAIQIKRVSRI